MVVLVEVPFPAMFVDFDRLLWLFILDLAKQAAFRVIGRSVFRSFTEVLFTLLKLNCNRRSISLFLTSFKLSATLSIFIDLIGFDLALTLITLTQFIRLFQMILHRLILVL